MWRLLHHPDQLRTLCAEPELIPNAVQELIRYQTPALLFRVLVAREDFRLGGTRIRRGDSVMPLTWAANRDPAHFEDPCGSPPHPALAHGPAPRGRAADAARPLVARDNRPFS
ncbi:cytochrome P450 [Streptomyces rectiverticillatus]|uniref:cytochrome P450 n=1 Tax=Streptomyces rectiverticillatus TaxID=173860 RepID=UPI003CCD6AF5|nr:cytochrome P450 [Streptomyces rectiverticillatus]